MKILYTPNGRNVIEGSPDKNKIEIETAQLIYGNRATK